MQQPSNIKNQSKTNNKKTSENIYYHKQKSQRRKKQEHISKKENIKQKQKQIEIKHNNKLNLETINWKNHLNTHEKKYFLDWNIVIRNELCIIWNEFDFFRIKIKKTESSRGFPMRNVPLHREDIKPRSFSLIHFPSPCGSQWLLLHVAALAPRVLIAPGGHRAVASDGSEGLGRRLDTLELRSAGWYLKPITMAVTITT